ncbi:MAG: HPP family protein [Hyphomicrobiales bacterium]
MELQKTNKDAMITNFSTIKADANLKEAYDEIKRNLEGPPHLLGLIVLDDKGRYAGVLTIGDFMQELRKLYRDACDKPGKKEWMEKFFDQCELVGIKKVSDIMSGKRPSIGVSDLFEKSCEMILYKKLHLLAVVDESSKPIGVITRRMVLTDIAPRVFK